MRQASSVHLLFEDWGRQFGPIYRVKVGGQRLVVVGDRQAVDEILRDRPEGYSRGNQLRAVLEELGVPGNLPTEGEPRIQIAEGEDWKRQRQLDVAALNPSYLESYFITVHAAVERLYRRLLEAAHDASSIDVTELLISFTMDATSSLSLGHERNAPKGGNAESLDHLERILATFARRLGAPIPYWRWLKLPADRALDRSLRALFGEIEGFVSQAKEEMEERPDRYRAPENLLEGLLAAQRADGAVSVEEVVYHVFMNLIAGVETTAFTLSWAIGLLGLHPHIQARLANEAVEVLGDEPIVGEYSATKRLAYAEAVLWESLRLKTVGPLMPVEANEDKVVCGVDIPAGTSLVLLLRLASRTAAGRSDEFYPERWLEDSDETRPLKSLGFGAGPRFCPGRNLALMETKTVISMIARNFELEVSDSAEVQEYFGISMSPRGLRVRVRTRQTEGAPVSV